MKREYLFIIITIFIALAGLIYKSVFVSDKLIETQGIIIENNDRHEKFKRDTIVQSLNDDIVETYKLNKRDKRNYGEIIAELLKTTEDILKESEIKYNVNNINQEVDEVKNWPNRTTKFYINVKFTCNYRDLIKLISIVEHHELLINIESMNYYRSNPEEKMEDEFSVETPMIVEIRLEYIKFL